MTKKLFWEAMIKFVAGVVLTGLCLFVSAGSPMYWNGWLLLLVLFVPMFLAGCVMMATAPNLLAKRLHAKETQKGQDFVIKVSALVFLLGFVAAGLEYRWDWKLIPKSISLICSVLLLVFYVLYAQVMRQNPYLYRTVKVEETQRVIDTGLYAVVRHPMYGITVVMFLLIPVVLGSVLSFTIFLGYPILIVRRIQLEEALLQQELTGYSLYQQKVKYRLIPYIW